MFARKIDIATKTLLLALTCAGVGLTRYASTQAGQSTAVLPPAPVGREPRLSENDETNEAELPAEKKYDQNFAEKMFPDGMLHDFGVLQRGIKAYHAFRVVNASEVPLKIVQVRVGMDPSTSCWSSKSALQPNEEGKIELLVDTRMFVGSKSRSLYVTIQNGEKWTEARLLVQSDSRDDLTLSPQVLDFTKIKRGATPTIQTTVTFLDSAKVQVTGAKCENNHIDVKFQELPRKATETSYRVSATLRADLPEGELNTHVELTTNNPAMPRVCVPLHVEVESPSVKEPEKKADKLDASNLEEKVFPDGPWHNFGSVQRGTYAYHAFRIVNTTDVPLHIVSARVSMNSGDAGARATKSLLQPNEEGKIEVFLDTSRFSGGKTMRVFVAFDRPRIMEASLFFSAVSRDDLAFFPQSLEFAKIKRGATPTTHMTVTYPVQAQLQVTGAKCDSNYIDIKLQELPRGPCEWSYRVSATIRRDIPAGELHTSVELTTNNPAMPKLRVPLHVEVEPVPIDETRTIPEAGWGRPFLQFPLLPLRRVLRP